MFHRKETLHCHVLPFPGANMDPASMAVNRIDPYHPFRFALSEQEALKQMLSRINQELIKTKCQRAILVGHNPWFDLSFIKAAVRRCEFSRNPFHSFSTFDTATLAGMAYGETILVKAALASSFCAL
jgi:ribonuclease T